MVPAAFGRLCVETDLAFAVRMFDNSQPPSGGCVLKPDYLINRQPCYGPAAFGRLCVETEDCALILPPQLCPAAFGRLCVETL